MPWKQPIWITLVVALGLLVSPATIQAQTCPCFTAQDLTAIIVDSCGCQNDLGGAGLTCTGINVLGGGACILLSTYGEGYAAVIDRPEFTAGPWECQWAYPPQPNPIEALAITPAEGLACAELIAAFGEVAQAENFECSLDSLPCNSDADCTSPLGFCAIDVRLSCDEDSDCPPIGECQGDGMACRSDDDCPGFLFRCVNREPQSCDFQTNYCVMEECLDDCFPPLCAILPTEGPSDLVEIVFTNQIFDVVSGDLSELRADGDFFRSNCTPANSVVWESEVPLLPGEGAYFLVRALEGVSCTDHGDSSLSPDPRRDLDVAGGCPP